MVSGTDPGETAVPDLTKARWSLCAREHIPANSVVPVDHASLWDWMDVEGPGDVLSLLWKAGKVPDPNHAQNDMILRWVENLDWAFRILFHVDADFLQTDYDISLIIKDLDCYSQIVLNGFQVGSTSNMFRQHRFSVEELLVPETNELIIYLRSQKRIAAALEAAHGHLPAGFDSSRVYSRRCQCWTGWDWAARLSSAGVLSAPSLEVENPLRLESPFAQVKDLPKVLPGASSAAYAQLALEVDIASQRKVRGTLTARLFGPDGTQAGETQLNFKAPIGKTTVRTLLRVEAPVLWWPIGFGDQPLYRLEITADATDRLGRSLSAFTVCKTAIRTASMDRSADSQGERFIPLINGMPVFCRGTNWIPTRILPGTATDDDYRILISAAAAAGMNCLRVWGGGIYERELFYDLCDEVGILVWQDFMFACAAYPVYKDFTDEVELEAEYQIKRLRNHPSIFLWCGNNENEWLHQIGELRLAREARIIGEPIWSGLLKRKVEDLDPSRAYHQSSPYGRNRTDFNDEATGDRHHWEVWARWQSPDAYLRDRGRFLSEFGFQSIPDQESVSRFAPAADSLFHPDLLHHQKMIQGQQRLIRYGSGMFRLPAAELGHWIELTQRLQAEVLRRGVEHWRRRKFDTAGALIWQHHDAWPALSWSLIDFYRRPKLAYLAARRFFSPVLLSASLLEDGSEVGAYAPSGFSGPRESPPSEIPVGREPIAEPLQLVCSPPDRRIHFILINDTPGPISGMLTVTIHLSTDGSEVTRATSAVQCQPNSNSDPFELVITELGLTDFSRVFLRARLEPDDASAARLQKITEEVEERCLQILGPLVDNPETAAAYRNPDFAAGLQTDVLLVEPLHFQWGDNVQIGGLGRPDWH